MSLSICQNCVYQNDVTMYTTYCINGICDLCGHHTMLAIVKKIKKERRKKMLQFIGYPEKQYCEKCAIKIAEQIGDEQEHFEQGYDESICSECGKEYKSYYLVKESNIQGWTVKARHIGEFASDDEASEYYYRKFGSLEPNEFILCIN